MKEDIFPHSVQPLFNKWGNNCPYIEKEIGRCITLPLHANLTNNEINFIIDQINNYERKRK
jgi:perosamine synthetase